MYLFRLVVSHTMEFAYLIRDAEKRPNALELLDSLSSDAISTRSTLVSLLDKSQPLNAAVAMQRNKTTFHYEKPGSDELRQAIAAVADHTDRWKRDEAHATSRAEFADEILIQLLVPKVRERWMASCVS
jgi:hypothetical protein